jgi:hypothetical protein
VLRTLIGVGGACFFAWLLFNYSIFTLGLPLIAFFTLLIAFGWAIGLAVSGLILRWGLGAGLAWAAISCSRRCRASTTRLACCRLAAGSRRGDPSSYVFEGCAPC